MESIGLRIFCDLDDYDNKKVSIPSIVRNSELIKILSENIDTHDNKLRLNLKGRCDFETLMYLEKLLANFDKLKYVADLELANIGSKLSDIMKYLMIYEDKIKEIELYNEMCKGFEWDFIIRTENMEEYFFSKVLYPENRKKVSIYPFLNTFLKNYYECSIDKIWIFINIFNKYTSCMKNLNQDLPKEYHTFNVFEFINSYDIETNNLIRTYLISESIFSIYESNFDSKYDFLVKYAELLELNNEYDIQEFRNFVMTHPDNENIYFAGSSTLYCTLKNYEKSNVNDIDIWMNIKNTNDFCNRFFKKSVNDLESNKYQAKLRKGILDIERKKGANIQFIHVENKTGYDIIQNFDLPFLTCYFQIRNQKQEFIMTTHCLEGLYQKKVLDLYNNVLDRASMQLQKRIYKYSQRGFSFNTHLNELIEDYDDNKDNGDLENGIRSTKYNFSTLDINRNALSKFSKEYFDMDFRKYYFACNNFFKTDLDVANENTRIIRGKFCDNVKRKIINKTHKFNIEFNENTMPIIYKSLGLNPYDYSNSPYGYHNFCRLILINSDTGLLINKFMKTNQIFNFELFKNDYDVDSIYYENGKLYFKPFQNNFNETNNYGIYYVKNKSKFTNDNSW